MPIIDIELVCHCEADLLAVSAHKLADALGSALDTPAARTWVRVRYLGSHAYAENQVAATPCEIEELPVFVTVLVTRPPPLSELANEITKLTAVVAACVGRSPERVHVQYAPAAAGRQAFGGKLVQ